MRLMLLGLVLVFAGCAQYRPLDVFVIGLTPMEGGALEQRVRVDLRIQNPNDQPLDARGLRLQLDVNGQRLARGVSAAPFAVPRLGETTTSIVASTSLFDLARQLVALPGRQTMNYVLKGTIFLEGMGRSIEFHQAGELGPVNPSPSRPLTP
jgi:LEA14-like dessication related protein